ncbi:hypothetical protein BB561_006023 [Smittium simulii]|uniref:Retrotransposon gag domain-containing protein n=1 Tax=Smittium simulii TaxID=133385 RepID=A0A2T9Y710_9FUNG|nr:hypothetical protein BB561_006023 [Smittium simulii]
MEHLISPFTGTRTEPHILLIYKFEQIARIQEWPDEKQTAYFKAYMVGTALEWIIETETLKKGITSFDQWEEIFLAKYKVDPVSKKKDLSRLEELHPQNFVNLEQFNDEFNKRLDEIDARYYTEFIIKTIYLRHMYSINSATTEQLLNDTDTESWKLKKIMNAFKRKAESKSAILDLISPPKPNSATTNVKGEKDMDMEKILEDLTVMFQLEVIEHYP